MIEHKTCKLNIKELTEEGTFSGVASVYGAVDLGNDVVEKGAFTKTIRERKGKVKILWQHEIKSPIGSGTLRDTPEGLVVDGELAMDVQQAREAHSLMKKGILDGLSIGFETVKDAITEGVRHLKELKLWEVSVVTFPMQLDARVTDVKAAQPPEEKRMFDESLELIELYGKRYQLINALGDSLDSIVWSSSLDRGTKITQVDQTIEQFHLAYNEFIPRYIDALATEGFSDKTTLELKEAKRWSDDARARISSAVDNLKALLKPDEAALSTPPTPEAAPIVKVKPDYHLMAKQVAAEIRQLA